MSLREITSKIETFDPNFPCKNCIIKMICSESCSSADEIVRSWNRDNRCMKFIEWIDYRREV